MPIASHAQRRAALETVPRLEAKLPGNCARGSLSVPELGRQDLGLQWQPRPEARRDWGCGSTAPARLASSRQRQPGAFSGLGSSLNAHSGAAAENSRSQSSKRQFPRSPARALPFPKPLVPREPLSFHSSKDPEPRGRASLSEVPSPGAGTESEGRVSNPFFASHLGRTSQQHLPPALPAAATLGRRPLPHA